MTTAAPAPEAPVALTDAAVLPPRPTFRLAGSLAIGVGLIVLTVASTLLVRLVGIGDPNHLSLSNQLQAPSFSAPFGTDAAGRDVFLRTIYASGLDLQVGFVTTAIPLAVGMALGLVSGYLGGWVDAVLMRVMDALLAFPFIVLIIGFVAIFGVGLTGIYVGLTLASIPLFARLTRGELLVLREQQFLMAARTLGYGNRRIIFKHALPHLLSPNLVFVPSVMLGNILALAALSYLGLGAQPPTAEWGAIIAEGQPYLLGAWWISTLPGLFVVVVGVGFSLTGEGLAERWQVRSA